MRVWTTKELGELLVCDELPVKVIEKERIKTVFLREVLPHDIALIPFEDDYLDFLTEKKRIGLNNPVIFVSKEPTMIQENLPAYNALLIDLKRTGKADIRNTLNFIIRICSEMSRPIPPLPKEMISEEPSRDKPEEDPENIKKVMEYLLKEAISIIISFPILEAETPVTVRGSCRIKEIIDNRLLLIRFRPITILKGIKEGLSVKAVFPAKTSFEGTLNILKVLDEEVITDIPGRLFIERRRFLRIEPSPVRPVLLYILRHDEPTIPLHVTDISQRGIGFLSGRDFNVKEIYPFTILLPGGETVVAYGAIKLKREEKDAFRYGVELFTHPKDEERIAEYVMQREIEIIQLLED
ncbi:MAG: PilZ domain-containing protein [Thermodesulfovibrionales bacterium]